MVLAILLIGIVLSLALPTSSVDLKYYIDPISCPNILSNDQASEALGYSRESFRRLSNLYYNIRSGVQVTSNTPRLFLAFYKFIPVIRNLQPLNNIIQSHGLASQAARSADRAATHHRTYCDEKRWIRRGDIPHTSDQDPNAPPLNSQRNVWAMFPELQVEYYDPVNHMVTNLLCGDGDLALTYTEYEPGWTGDREPRAVTTLCPLSFQGPPEQRSLDTFIRHYTSMHTWFNFTLIDPSTLDLFTSFVWLHEVYSTVSNLLLKDSCLLICLYFLTYLHPLLQFRFLLHKPGFCGKLIIVRLDPNETFLTTSPTPATFPATIRLDAPIHKVRTSKSTSIQSQRGSQ